MQEQFTIDSTPPRCAPRAPKHPGPDARRRWALGVLRKLGKAGAMAAIVLTPALSAAVPPLVPYFGQLTHSSGLPYNGNTTLEVRLYGTQGGGPLLASENFGTIAVNSGVFSVMLGSVQPAMVSAMQGGDERWLEFVVAGQPLLPRQRVATVPFALRAGDSAALGGVPASGWVKSAELLDTLEGDVAWANQSCPAESVVTGVDASGAVLCDPALGSQACTDCVAPLVTGQQNLANQLSSLASGQTAAANDLDAIAAGQGATAAQLALLGANNAFNGATTSAVSPNANGSVLERLELLQGSSNLHGRTLEQSEFLKLYGDYGLVATWSVYVNNGVLDESVPSSSYNALVNNRSFDGICQAIHGSSAFARRSSAGSSGYVADNGFSAYVAADYPVSPVLVIRDKWSHVPNQQGTVINNTCHTYSIYSWEGASCSVNFADRYLLAGYTGYVTFVLPCVR